MENTHFITTRDLYNYATKHNLLDARIRVCDAMAVNFYPKSSDVTRARYEIVIDVSACEMIEFDDLPAISQKVYE